jgi:hypothetical protein
MYVNIILLRTQGTIRYKEASNTVLDIKIKVLGYSFYNSSFNFVDSN